MEKKIYFTYSADTKDGFIPQVPMTTSILTDASVAEIEGKNVLEKVPSLADFIEEVYRLLVPGGKATFTSPYYTTVAAWESPLTKRAISERSLNFASKEWRDTNKFIEVPMTANFEVNGQFAIEESCMQRSDEVRGFWLSRYNNVAQAVLLSLTKK